MVILLNENGKGDFEVCSWDTQSTDYSASEFHESRGTGCVYDLSEDKADRLFQMLRDCPNIARVVVYGPDGTLSWDRYEPTPPEFIGSDVDADNY